MFRLPRLSSDAIVRESRVQRNLPWAVNPFGPATDGHGTAQRHDKHISFILLFLDLSVVATLNVYSNTHDVSSGDALASFATYLIILTWIWCVRSLTARWLSNTLFDVRYFCRDIYNYFVKLCQLLVFAFICAFGGAFSISDLHIKVDLEDDLSGERIQNVAATRAWNGIAITFAVSRLICVIQYAILLLWRRAASRKLLFPLAAAAVSGLVWIGMFAYTGPSDALRITLCFGVIGLEMAVSLVVAALYRPVASELHILVERMALLSLIVLGEGVIGVCSSMSAIVSGIGFVPSSYVLLFVAILIIYEVYLVLFQQFDMKSPLRSLRAQWWCLLHLPLFLCVLLVIEANGNVLLFSNLMRALNYWSETLGNFLEAILNGTTGDFTETQKMKFADSLALIGSSYNEAVSEFSGFGNVTNATDATLDRIQQRAFAYFAQIIASTWVAYNLEIPSDAREVYINSFANATDLGNSTQTNFNLFLEDLINEVAHSSLYLMPTAGGVLLLSVLLFYVQKPPADWAAVLFMTPRMVVGVALCLLGLLDVGGQHIEISATGDIELHLPTYLWLDSNWMLPTLAIVLGALLIGEIFLLKGIVKRYKPVAVENHDATSTEKVAVGAPVLKREDSPPSEASEPSPVAASAESAALRPSTSRRTAASSVLSDLEPA